MASEERKFEQVLDSLAEKEKRAQRRATILTGLTLAVGLLLIAVFSWQIVGLRKTRTALQQEVTLLETNKAVATEELEAIRADLAEANKELKNKTDEIKNIGKNIGERRYDEVKRIISESVDNTVPVNVPRGWAIPISGERSLVAAKAKAADAQSHGYRAVVCHRHGVWRPLAVFASKSQGEASRSRIRSELEIKGNVYVVELSDYCSTARGVCQCQP